jgi:hypothetical protein
MDRSAYIFVTVTDSWPTATLSPTLTVGVHGAPMCCCIGSTTFSGDGIPDCFHVGGVFVVRNGNSTPHFFDRRENTLYINRTHLFISFIYIRRLIGQKTCFA